MGKKPDKIALIAGSGKYPLYLLREIKKTGIEVVVLVLGDEAEPALNEEADKVHILNIGQLGKMIKTCRDEYAQKVIFAGRLAHDNIYKKLELDKRALSLLIKLKDRKADTILNAIAGEFSKDGLELIDSIQYMSGYFSPPGILTKQKPTKKEQDDIKFGFKIAKGIAGFDIGQTVVVKDNAVLAVEAMEGTDLAIRRGAELGHEGVVVVKVSKPAQDRRFDLPVMGMHTVKVARDCGVRVIAFSAGMTLLLDRDEMVKTCNSHGIVLAAIQEKNEQ